MATFEFVSFIIGLLLGMIIMLILVWIAYYTRTFVFTYCPTQARPCGGADYYNDPGDALANNPNLEADDILFLNDKNEMFYNRVQKVTSCVPESNQTVYMKFPQYCSFSNTGGTAGVWKETAFNSNMYKADSVTSPHIIVTNGNCDPVPNQIVTSGVPIVKWDPNPLSV